MHTWPGRSSDVKTEVMTSRPHYYTRLGVLVYQGRKTDEGRRAWRENTRCYLSRNMLRLECKLVLCVCITFYKFLPTSSYVWQSYVCCFLKIASVCLWAKIKGVCSDGYCHWNLGVPIKCLEWDVMRWDDFKKMCVPNFRDDEIIAEILTCLNPWITYIEECLHVLPRVPPSKR